MRKKTCLVWTLSLSLALVPALRALPETSRAIREPDAQEATAATASSVEAPVPTELSWLEGHWVGRGFGGVVEEVWSPARGGVMMGMFRGVVDGKASLYELMTLTRLEGRWEMRLKHFNADLSGWEEKAESLSWPASDLGETSARFGPVFYELVGEGKLVVWVELEDSGPAKLEFEKVN